MIQDKIKVTIINASPRNDGRTRETIQLIKKKLSSNFMFRYDNYDLNDLKINFCKGCQHCFESNICSLDKTDDLEAIKISLLTSDIIIFAMPVYAKQIPAQLKVVIDRLSYWLHRMPLHNCGVVLVCCASSNGIEEVSNYMYDICSWMGLFTLFIISNTKLVSQNQLNCQIDILLMNIKIFIKNRMLFNDLNSNNYKFLYHLPNTMRGKSEKEYWNEIKNKIGSDNYVDLLKYYDENDKGNN